MSVTRADVDRIAELARLRLDEGEADRLTGEMNRILEHADRLRAQGLEVGRSSGPGMPLGASEPPEASEGDTDVRGGRKPGADDPDVLTHEPSDFAPRFEEGFFVVPPPHGVQADG